MAIPERRAGCVFREEAGSGIRFGGGLGCPRPQGVRICDQQLDTLWSGLEAERREGYPLTAERADSAVEHDASETGEVTEGFGWSRPSSMMSWQNDRRDDRLEERTRRCPRQAVAVTHQWPIEELRHQGGLFELHPASA